MSCGVLAARGLGGAHRLWRQEKSKKPRSHRGHGVKPRVRGSLACRIRSLHVGSRGDVRLGVGNEAGRRNPATLGTPCSQWLGGEWFECSVKLLDAWGPNASGYSARASGRGE